MVNVIGLGYIGLPTALMMASHGVEVIGTDYNKELVATLNAGKTTFKEKGLDELRMTSSARRLMPAMLLRLLRMLCVSARRVRPWLSSPLFLREPLISMSAR